MNDCNGLRPFFFLLFLFEWAWCSEAVYPIGTAKALRFSHPFFGFFNFNYQFCKEL